MKNHRCQWEAGSCRLWACLKGRRTFSVFCMSINRWDIRGDHAWWRASSLIGWWGGVELREETSTVNLDVRMQTQWKDKRLLCECITDADKSKWKINDLELGISIWQTHTDVNYVLLYFKKKNITLSFFSLKYAVFSFVKMPKGQEKQKVKHFLWIKRSPSAVSCLMFESSLPVWRRCWTSDWLTQKHRLSAHYAR